MTPSLQTARRFPERPRQAGVASSRRSGRPAERQRARQAMSIRETDKPCQARLAVLPYVLSQLAGLDAVPDRGFDVLHVCPSPSCEISQ